MGAKATHSRTQGGLETMMITLSQYDLDELYEIRDALNKEIEDKEDKLRDQAFEQEDMQLEEAMEEFRG